MQSKAKVHCVLLSPEVLSKRQSETQLARHMQSRAVAPSKQQHMRLLSTWPCGGQQAGFDDGAKPICNGRQLADWLKFQNTQLKRTCLLISWPGYYRQTHMHPHPNANLLSPVLTFPFLKLLQFRSLTIFANSSLGSRFVNWKLSPIITLRSGSQAPRLRRCVLRLCTVSRRFTGLRTSVQRCSYRAQRAS